jgi:zinc transporter ZupT
VNVAAGRIWPRERTEVRWGWAATLVLAVAATLGSLVFMSSHGIDRFLDGPPVAIPKLSIERVTFRPGAISVSVRNTGREPASVRQVIVDDAYREFAASRGRRVGRLASTQLRVRYPWIAGDPLTIRIVDETGATHDHLVAAAALTPVASGRTVVGYIVLGAYVGVIPVFLGLLFLPALARLGRSGRQFLLGLSAGLLAFLAVDALTEALELSGQLASVLHGGAIVFGGAAATYGLLAFAARGRSGEGAGGATSAQPLVLATLIAVGIGLHNFGEGLAVGSAQARGEVALGATLMIGFALHNLTEGIGIAAPTLGRLPDWRRLAALGAVAGLPTIAGTVIGGLAYSTLLGTLCLAAGLGAIAQVVDQLARFALRQKGSLGAVLAGAGLGFVLMYATALGVAA